MSSSITIRVSYPPGHDGRLVLRTDDDWDRDLEADALTADGSCSEFNVSSEKPYFYFKPLFVGAGEVHSWSKGNNYLAILNAQESRHVYPHFFDERGPRGSDPLEIPSASSISPHQIRVFYPPGYWENTLKQYPVLYMQDGPNLFFPHEAFTGEHWRVPETLSILESMNLIRKTLVVGIYPQDRMSEYTRPGYERYGRYLAHELKPHIDGTHRTLRDARNTAVMGSSLGGVVSFYLAWEYPEVFGMAASMSSTFGYRDDLFRRVQEEEKRPIRIYLDSGWPEDNYEVTRAMHDLLLRKGYEGASEMLYFAFPQAVHNERYWAMRSHLPFQFFFGKVPAIRDGNAAEGEDV